ncbi:MAG: hypothetical protein ABF856_16685, partial [Acetobacter aceti]
MRGLIPEPGIRNGAIADPVLIVAEPLVGTIVRAQGVALNIKIQLAQIVALSRPVRGLIPEPGIRNGAIA